MAQVRIPQPEFGFLKPGQKLQKIPLPVGLPKAAGFFCLILSGRACV
jgi:hypothetical protein